MKTLATYQVVIQMDDADNEDTDDLRREELPGPHYIASVLSDHFASRFTVYVELETPNPNGYERGTL